MTDLTVALRITGDASGLKAEVAQASTALSGLGPAAAGGASGAAAPLRQTEEAARRTAAGLQETATGARAAGEAAGITAQQMRMLAPQLNDLATQIASGGGIFLPLIQQAGQITPIFGGLSGTMAALGGAIGPVGLTAGAAAIAIGALVVSGERSERALNALENRLQATREGYVALAKSADDAARALTADSGTSLGDSRAAAGILAGSRGFAASQQDMNSLLRTAADLGAVLGRDVPAGAALLAKALDDPAAVAKELAASGFRGFNATMARQIELLQLSGEKGRASAEVIARIGETAKGAAQNQTELQKAWEDLGNAADRLGNRLAPVAALLARLAGSGINSLADDPSRLLGILPGGGAAAFALRYFRGGAAPNAPAETGVPGFSTGGTMDAANEAASRALNDAIAKARGLNPRSLRREDNAASAAGLRAALPDADPGQRRILEAGLGELSREAYGLRGPAAEQFQSLQDQAALARRMPGADQTIAAAQLQFRRTMERDGGGASDAQLAEVAALAQRRLTQEAITYTDQLLLQAEGLDKVAAATALGGRAASEAADQVRAEAEARKFSSVTDADHATQVQLLANSYGTLRDAQQAVRDGQAQFDQQQQVQMLEAETAAIGGNVRERNRDLAVLRERQRILKEPGGDPNSAAGQARLANAGTIADRTQDLNAQQANFNELANFGERAADRIGTALTNASIQGQDAFKSLKNVGKAIVAEIAQEFFKLSLVNPLKNAITGGSAPTFGGILSLFGGSSGGSISSSAPMTGGAPSSPDFIAGSFQGIGQHAGGIMGAEATFIREIPTSLYAGAPRFHTGLAPDEVPAILQKGEGVFTPAQMASLGPAGGSHVFAPTINFQGDAGSAADRQSLIEQMRTVWLSDIARSAPAIANSANAALISDIRRRGQDQVFR